jgi:hypothetical protein
MTSVIFSVAVIVLRVINDGRTWTKRSHFDCIESGCFVVEEDGFRLGQLRLHFSTKGAYNTPHFFLERFGPKGWYRTMDEYELPFAYTLRQGQPGYAVALRALSRRISKLQAPMFRIPKSAREREPMFYMPKHWIGA